MLASSISNFHRAHFYFPCVHMLSFRGWNRVPTDLIWIFYRPVRAGGDKHSPVLMHKISHSRSFAGKTEIKKKTEAYSLGDITFQSFVRKYLAWIMLESMFLELPNAFWSIRCIIRYGCATILHNLQYLHIYFNNAVSTHIKATVKHWLEMI